MKLKKLASLFLTTVVVSTTLLAGCGKSESASTSETTDPNAPVTVTFWAASVTQERQEFFDWFADYVHETYPNITLDMLGVPEIFQITDRNLM